MDGYEHINVQKDREWAMDEWNDDVLFLASKMQMLVSKKFILHYNANYKSKRNG